MSEEFSNIKKREKIRLEKKLNLGHLAALITIVIWATTFVSTKILLESFEPIEILLFRFVLGYIALLLVYPKPLHVKDKRQELYFALAGLTGICTYYLLENIALTYTQASNVGVVISVAPIFTALLSRFFLKDRTGQGAGFYAGFALAIIGIMLISFEGRALQLNPLGDLLALLAALVWACYSLLGRKIASFGYNTIQTTRRTFAYGIGFMLPTLLFFDFSWDLSGLSSPVNLFNLLYLGLGASALCFVTWNYAVKTLGALKTSIYIYLVPVITVLFSVLILHETITLVSAAGILLTIAGLAVSQKGEFNNFKTLKSK